MLHSNHVTSFILTQPATKAGLVLLHYHSRHKIWFLPNMPPTLMTDEMRHLLWANVDDHKGEDSLWLTDFDEAYAGICATWQAHGYTELGQKQLRTFFNHIARRQCNTMSTVDEIFAKGTMLLKPHYRSALLPAAVVQTNNETSHNFSIDVAWPTDPLGSSSDGPAVRRKAKIGQLATFPCSSCSVAGRDCVITACDSCCHHCTIAKRKASRDRSGDSARPAP